VSLHRQLCETEGAAGAARCPSCSQNAHGERSGMTPVLIPCSRNAHDQNVLVRRPQWDQARVPFQERETSKLGRIIYIVRCAQ
jgi:hypothetical protein